MASKRRPIHTPDKCNTTNMNFRPGGFETTRNETKGTRPTATPTTIQEVILKMILHVCKKSIFFDTNIKVALYLATLFLISLIGDFIPFPKSYFSRSDNLFNLYFVKMGWGWTTLFSTPFMILTSYTICCGDMNRILRNHLPRIVISTLFWYIWTNTFNIIESAYGRCSVRTFVTKSTCLKNGYFWNGLDLSGHAFILIYSSLVLIEEARPIINWDNIREHLRNEEHNRQSSTTQHSNPLKNLKEGEIKNLKYLYTKHTNTIRLLFIGITVLQLLWDVMLICTILYYHKMIEKVVSGIIAILTWYFTYRYWYPSTSILPDAPGKGMFQYQKDIKVDPIPLKRNPSIVNQNTRTQASPRTAMPSRQMGNNDNKFTTATLGSNVGLSS